MDEQTDRAEPPPWSLAPVVRGGMSEPKGPEMTKLTLTDREEDDPEPDRARRRHDDNVFIRLWLPIILVTITLFGSGRDGFGWVFGRESKEREMTAQIESLKGDVLRLREEVVRKDIYTLTMQNINDRLASIDKKLSERR